MRRAVWVAGVALAAAVGVVVWLLVFNNQSADTVDLQGTLTLHGRTSHNGYGWCAGEGGYSDITEGAPITVYDGTGAIIATGQLGPGDDREWNPRDTTARSNTCWFSFTVTVPRTPFYQVEVSHRGPVRYSWDDTQSGGVALTVG